MNNYIKLISKVFSGNIIAQIIPILSYIAIARLYSPSEFGIFSSWLAVIMIASVVVTGRYETALVNEDDGKQRYFAVAAITCITLISTSFLSIIFLIFSSVFEIKESFFINLNSIIFILLSTISIMIVTLIRVWQSWFAANGSYNYLISVRICQSLTIALFQIFAGILFVKNSLTLIFAYFAGVIFTFLVSFYLNPIFFNFSKNRHTLYSFIKRYRKFPLWSLPADTLNTLTVNIPILIINSKFGAEAAGYLSLTLRTLGAPISLIANAILDVFKRTAAQEFKNYGNCVKIYLHTFYLLSFVSFLIVIFLFFSIDYIILFAFGSSWKESAEIGFYMLPLFALRFIASPLSYMVYISQKVHIDFIWQSFLFIFTFSALQIGDNFYSSIIYYTYSYFFMYLIYLIISYRLSRGSQ